MSCKLVAFIGRAALLLPLAQSGTSTPSLEAVKLEPPVYPPYAMAARVSGEVDLKITLKPDGTPRTVQVGSGPQNLRQAAVESATRSRFEVAPGNSAGESYQLIYRFVLDEARGCGQDRDKSYPHIHYESNTITISEQPMTTCDPVAEPTRVRSIKCLFLWKCGLR